MPLPTAETALSEVRAGRPVIRTVGRARPLLFLVVGLFLLVCVLAMGSAMAEGRATGAMTLGEVVATGAMALLILTASLFCLAGAARLLHRPIRLRLDRSGISEQVRRRGEWQTTTSLGWPDYEEFTEVTYQPRWPGPRYRRVLFRLTPQAWQAVQQAGPDNRFSRWLRDTDRTLLGERTLMLNPLYGPAPRLLPVLQALHREYAGPNRSR
ncbi:hypothetical protein [Naumannella halotolerans]|uniref:Uncharacterized protein n=1 Tax=Naumannella halotolerans TaxID=993414 RepID=A0A4R7J2F7_9ACTN|nr:hypothetical protein [Naumannella halotolerans]TDT31195.1 hypothetical protein CLV29_2609 [Naumannella halotolerans]